MSLHLSPHLSPMMSPIAKKKAKKKAHLSGRIALGVNSVRTSFLMVERAMVGALEAHLRWGVPCGVSSPNFWQTGAATALRDKCELFVALLHHQLQDAQLRVDDQSMAKIQLKQCWRLLFLVNRLQLELSEIDASQKHMPLAVDETALSTREALLTAALLLLQRAKTLISAIPAGRRERIHEAKTCLMQFDMHK